MSWSAPFTAVNTTTITSSSWNTSGRDNLSILKSNAWQLIASNILTSTASSVALTPTTGFKNLKIVCFFQSNTSLLTLRLTFNGDTGSNYDYCGTEPESQSNVFGLFSGSAVASANIAPATAASDANYCSQGEIIIFDYLATDKHKVIISEATENIGPGSGESVYKFLYSGWWRNTAAITSITLTASANSFNTNSSFYLYGG